MSINKLNLLVLQLLFIVGSLGIGCWARPKWPEQQQQQQHVALNEVTSQEDAIVADQTIPNNFVEELADLRSTRGYYKKRRSFFKSKLLLQHSPFRGRFYNAPEVEVMPPGGANYYSNEVLPLSTYEIYEPEPMYYY